MEYLALTFGMGIEFFRVSLNFIYLCWKPLPRLKILYLRIPPDYTGAFQATEPDFESHHSG